MGSMQDFDSSANGNVAFIDENEILEQTLRDHSNNNVNAGIGRLGRTPLMIAAAQGYLDTVKTLIDNGADVNLVDKSGMGALEWASIFGKLEVAQYVKSLMSDSAKGRHLATTAVSNKQRERLLEGAESLGIEELSPLVDKSVVVIQLGSADTRKSPEIVSLHSLVNHGQDYLALVITSREEGITLGSEQRMLKGYSSLLQPVVFQATDPSKVEVTFELIASTQSKDKIEKLGTAVALFSILPRTEGKAASTSLAESDILLPILGESGLKTIGKITFNTIIIKPFNSPSSLDTAQNDTGTPRQVFPPQSQDIHRSLVAGHRGLGKNSAQTTHLQLGENTITSFNAAADAGAKFIEFDVQVSADGVPVIYHDNLVAETGVDTAVHELTLEEFLRLGPRSEAQTQKSLDMAQGRLRSMSDSNTELVQKAGAIKESQMKSTFALTKLGFKSNTPGRHISGPLTTLSEVFDKVYPNVGFNIEVKYPILSIAQVFRPANGGAWYGFELNRFVDRILDVVFQKTKGMSSTKTRQIYFSSFNPDICLLLRLKQNRYPVMFLTTAGLPLLQLCDVRAHSLWTALAFTKKWDLDGIVSIAQPFITAPGLIQVLKDEVESERGTISKETGTQKKRKDFAILSYGDVNNEVENVRVQIEEGGIDAVIVDRVGLIVKAAEGMQKGMVGR